jgi:hypothetical protein
MSDMVPFTNNYVDQSTREGYQFEFDCMRCGNGHTSPFQHSVTGFGGRLLQLGGDLVGGSVGEKASQLGFDATWLRDGSRGSTRDRALAQAAEKMRVHFEQCHRCGQWVCKAVCWNPDRGMCAACAPRLDQEIAGMQAEAQVSQLNARIQQVDWTQDVNHRDQLSARCATCEQEAGGGNFCQHCGTRQTARVCRHCHTSMAAAATFCTECGTPAE